MNLYQRSLRYTDIDAHSLKSRGVLAVVKIYKGVPLIFYIEFALDKKKFWEKKNILLSLYVQLSFAKKNFFVIRSDLVADFYGFFLLKT